MFAGTGLGRRIVGKSRRRWPERGARGSGDAGQEAAYCAWSAAHELSRGAKRHANEVARRRRAALPAGRRTSAAKKLSVAWLASIGTSRVGGRLTVTSRRARTWQTGDATRTCHVARHGYRVCVRKRRKVADARGRCVPPRCVAERFCVVAQKKVLGSVEFSCAGLFSVLTASLEIGNLRRLAGW
jgi:hypothetical protein